MNKNKDSIIILKPKTTLKEEVSSRNASKLHGAPREDTTSRSKGTAQVVLKKTSSTTLLKPKPSPSGSRSDHPTAKAKSNAKTSDKIPKRVPLRAVFEPKPQPPISAPSSHNVMNRIHNVTVISPPSVRKDYAAVPSVTDPPVAAQRERTRTRTLEANEVLVLQKSNVAADVFVNHDPVRDPVAFDIHFEPPVSASMIVSTDPKVNHVQPATINDSEDDEYEDDFDSYESDFESYSNSSNTSTVSHSSAAIGSLVVNEAVEVQSHHGSGRDHQELMDSGLYDIKTELPVEVKANAIFHIDDSEAQKDSGFG